MWGGIELGATDTPWHLMIWYREWHAGLPVMLRIIDIRTPLGCLGFRRILPTADTDHPHNHGASFWSLFVWGGYNELVWDGVPWSSADRRDHEECDLRPPDRKVIRSRWLPRWIRKEECHRVVDVRPLTLTVVLSGPLRGTVGYGYVSHRPSAPQPPLHEYQWSDCSPGDGFEPIGIDSARPVGERVLWRRPHRG